MPSIEKSLQEFGLSPNQIQVYAALLGLGEARAQEIAGRAKVLRTTTYEVLEQLKTLGLVTQFQRKGRRVYAAEAPATLERLLESRKQALQTILPELRSLYNVGAVKPKIHYYEGLEGCKTVLEDTLTTSDKRLYGILSIRDLHDFFGDAYFRNYTARRIGSGIHLQVIRCEAHEVKTDRYPDSPQELRRVRFAPPDFVFSLTMYLYDNKVLLISSKREAFGLIIESKEFHQTQKALFEILWNASQRSVV